MAPWWIVLIFFVCFFYGFKKRRACSHSGHLSIVAVGAIVAIGIAFLLFNIRLGFNRTQVNSARRQAAEVNARVQKEAARWMAESQQQTPQPMADFAAPAAAPPMRPGMDVSFGTLTAQVRVSPGIQSGNARVPFELYDNVAQDCTIHVKYSPDGGKTWRPATEAEGGSGTSGLSSSRFGSKHRFLWNSLVDVGAVRNPNVQIRVEPSSGSGGGVAGTSSLFVVDNRKFASHAPKLSAVSPNGRAATPSWVVALGDALLRAWTGDHPRASTPSLKAQIAEQAERYENSPSFAGPQLLGPPPAAAAKTGTAPKPPQAEQRPAWVNADPKMEGVVYLMTLHVGPYTSSVECERELPKALQGAVADYAELLLGREQAQAAQLPDELLRQKLVRQQWLETRREEFNGIKQDMTTLHVQVGFDPAMQQQIRSLAARAADYAIVDRRLRLSGLVLSGVLGFLSLVWAILGALAKCPSTNEAQATAAAAKPKGRGLPLLLLGGLLLAVFFLAALVAR